MPRKKKEELEVTESVVTEQTEKVETEEFPVAEEAVKPKRTRKKAVEETPIESKAETPLVRSDKILTIDANADIEEKDYLADIIWHEIHNAYRTRRILTAKLVGIERDTVGKSYLVADYKGFRIILPIKEMFFDLPNDLHSDIYRHEILKYSKLANSMLGAEIDIIVKGIDSKTRSVVASRTDAMLKKRQTFYMETDAEGMFRIYEDRIVQARIIAVAEKTIRIEIFGVECSMSVRDLSSDWIGDARERYSIGDHILVRITSVSREDIKNITVKAEARSVRDDKSNNLSLCKIQGKYAGKIIDIHKGVIYVRLASGVNVIVHSCLDRKLPGKKDDVSVAITSLDEERGVAMGIITRIIKQNI